MWPTLEEAGSVLDDSVFKRLSQGEDGCWVWSGVVVDKTPMTSASEGRISVRRLVFLACGGTVLPGAKLGCKCKNIRCVSPEHVGWVVNRVSPRFDDLVEAWLRSGDPSPSAREVAELFGMNRPQMRETLYRLSAHPERMRPDQREPFDRAIRLSDRKREISSMAAGAAEICIESCGTSP